MFWEPHYQIDTATVTGNHEEFPMSDDASSTSDNSDEWCSGSIGSVKSLGDSCCSVTSTFCCDNQSILERVDGNCCTQDLEPLSIAFYESRQMAHQQQTVEPATVVSSACSSTSRSCMEDEEDLDDIVMLHNETKPSSVPAISPLEPFSVATGKALKSRRAFDQLPDELAFNVFSFLNVDSLNTARSVSKRFHTLASRDEAGWLSICESVWNRKAHVCWRAAHQKQIVGSMVAYRESCHDGRNRHEITPIELCFDPLTGRGTVWYFRFKESAGSAWTSLDPWYSGLQARKMVFLRDGTIWDLLPSATLEKLGGDEDQPHKPGSSFRLIPAFFDTLAAHARDPAQNHHQNVTIPPRDGMKWRFILQPMDQPVRPRGAFVRINVRGRDVPTYIVQRSPTQNWGFVMENCWGVFASFPLPLRQSSERHVRDRPARMRPRWTSAGVGRWLNANALESDNDDEYLLETAIYADDAGVEEDTDTAIDSSLLEDAALPTTNRRQWREALLYNYGATTLPEGEGATAEFDRIFQSFRSPRGPLDMHNFLR
jgi:hypothetical protein